MARTDPPRWTAAGSRGRPVSYWIGFLGTAALAVAALLVAAKVLATPRDRPAASPTLGPTSVAAARWRSIEETFDGLPMASKLPAPWSVSGSGLAEIVALPTSVDRSVRISSTVNGEVTSACRSTAVVLGGSIRIAVDFLLGRPPSSTVPLVTIESGTTRQVGFGMDPSGTPVAIAADGSVDPGDGPDLGPSPPAVSTSPGSARWQRLDVAIDTVTGRVQWQVHDASGAETGSGETQVSNPSNGNFETICFMSPHGSPSGWIAIDDLVVEG